MRGPRFTAQMPNTAAIAQPDQAAPCQCKKSGMGFALTDTFQEWPWQTWLLMLVAAWLVYRELTDRSPKRGR